MGLTRVVGEMGTRVGKHHNRYGRFLRFIMKLPLCADDTLRGGIQLNYVSS